MNVPFNFPYLVARRTLDLLKNHKVMLRPEGVVFYVWQRDERVILAFDTTAVVLDKLNDRFAHELSTILRGRRVVRTNTRGIFFQVGFEIPPAPILLDNPVKLDLSQQPTPWHIPIGMTRNGPMWLSLTEKVDSLLVGGTRRMGKSGFTHGIIEALLHGGRTQVYAWDGKAGLEYARYVGHPNFHFIGQPGRGVLEIQKILDERRKQLQVSGYNSTAQHNAAGQDFIEPIALIVDEIALLDDQIKKDLKVMIEWCGNLGLHPVLATNNTLKSAVLVKSNLATRVCYGVPGINESLNVLGKKGAETLPKMRGMILWENELIEFQSFAVPYIEPTEEQRRIAQDLSNFSMPDVAVETEPVDPIAQLAESIRDRWQPGMSLNKVCELMGKRYGGSWTHTTKKVVEYLTTTTTSERPLSGENDPETGG